MVFNIMKNKILFVFIILVFGCENKNNSYNFNDKKYEECSVLLDLKWGKPYKYEHTRKAVEILKESNTDYKENFEYYSFDSLIEHKGDFIFYFTDRCNKKEKILKQYVEKYLIKVDGFPKYEIKPIFSRDETKILSHP